MGHYSFKIKLISLFVRIGQSASSYKMGYFSVFLILSMNMIKEYGGMSSIENV